MEKNLKEKFWYNDNQFANQYYRYPQRLIIENRWKIFKKIILEHNFRKNKILVLDLGCGDGINIVGIRKILNSLNIKYSLEAVDINEKRLKKVNMMFSEIKTFKFDIIKDKIDKKYDLVIFNHVLEHIIEDELALKNLSNLLSDEGLVILGVPNEGCFLAKLRNNIFQRKIIKYTDHVNFYTLDTLREKVEKYFFISSIYREGYFFPHLRLTNLFRKHKIGIIIENILLKINPSQSAGLILGLKQKK